MPPKLLESMSANVFCPLNVVFRSVVDTVAQFVLRAQSEPIFPTIPGLAGELSNSIRRALEANTVLRDILWC